MMLDSDGNLHQHTWQRILKESKGNRHPKYNQGNKNLKHGNRM